LLYDCGGGIILNSGRASKYTSTSLLRTNQPSNLASHGYELIQTAHKRQIVGC
jgi:hypothetical protein